MRRFTFDDLQRAMRECAGEPEPVGQGDDLLDRTFDELGYDSIAVMTMTSKIERDLEVSLPEGEVGFADTLRDYLSFVNGRLAGQFRETR